MDLKMVRRNENDTIMMPRGSASIHKTYNDSDDESDSCSSNDCEGIRMPDGPPPSRAPPIDPRANVILPLPGQPPLPQEPPLLPRFSGIHSYNPPPTYHQGVGISSHNNGAHSRPKDHDSVRTSHPLPPRPFASTSQTNPPPEPPSTKSAAVISAEPVLRDLKKESTAFVPTAIRKKQAIEKAKAAKGGLPSVVNAAPGATRDMTKEDGQNELIISLQSQIEQRSGSNTKQSEQDDYQKFLGNVQDLL